MNDREVQAFEFRAPLAKVIREAALDEHATPTDRLAAAVMLLAMETHESNRPITAEAGPPDSDTINFRGFKIETREDGVYMNGTKVEPAIASTWHAPDCESVDHFLNPRAASVYRCTCGLGLKL